MSLFVPRSISRRSQHGRHHMFGPSSAGRDGHFQYGISRRWIHLKKKKSPAPAVLWPHSRDHRRRRIWSTKNTMRSGIPPVGAVPGGRPTHLTSCPGPRISAHRRRELQHMVPFRQPGHRLESFKTGAATSMVVLVHRPPPPCPLKSICLAKGFGAKRRPPSYAGGSCCFSLVSKCQHQATNADSEIEAAFVHPLRWPMARYPQSPYTTPTVLHHSAIRGIARRGSVLFSYPG